MTRRRPLAGLILGVAMLADVAVGVAQPVRPKLVVVVSVDQLSLELFQRYETAFTGGLKRLSHGLVFTGYQSHAATETCPGHSTILTGDHPSRTGIVANDWYDRKSRSSVYCVSVPGSPDPTARGSGLLRVDTLGDWLKAAAPGSRSISVSGKDRAAIMLGGHHPDAVYWWNDGEGFASSSYAGPTTARTLNAARSFNSALAADWRERAPQLWPANVPTHCRALERAGRFGTLTLSGAVPSAGAKNLEREKSVIESGGFSDELHASPLFDQLALAFAERLVRADHLGRGESTDLLAVSLSATDYIGHRYGNGGAESCAQLAALDEALGAFFEHLDRLNVPYIVVLTADHGAIDAPERLRPPAQRIDIGAFSAALTRHLREAFALDYDPLAGDDPRQIVFNLRPADDVRHDAMVGDALAWLKKRPEVAAAFTADEIAASTPARGKPARDLTVAERFNESFDRDRSGDILVAYAERSTLGIPHGLGDAVASHGSPWDYDRQVPILWWWPRVVPVAETEPMETVDIAPTLAAIIGVAAPPVDGRCADLGQGCPSSPR